MHLASLFNFHRAKRTNEPPYYAALNNDEYQVAISLLKKAIANEDAHAMATYGALLMLGKGVDQDQAEAALWLRQSAVRGDIMGQCALGTLLASGSGAQRNDDEAAYWLFLSAKQGNHRAVEILADLALRNQSVVGPHFSNAELNELIRRRKRIVTL